MLNELLDLPNDERLNYLLNYAKDLEYRYTLLEANIDELCAEIERLKATVKEILKISIKD